MSIDVGPGVGAPCVLTILIGSDAAEDGMQPILHRPMPTNPHEVPLPSHDGSPFFIAPHPVLAVGKTRYGGEPVAVVIAETLWQAMDAAERLAVVSGARAIRDARDVSEFGALVPRYEKFESISLQRRVCEPSVPRRHGPQ